MGHYKNNRTNNSQHKTISEVTKEGHNFASETNETVWVDPVSAKGPFLNDIFIDTQGFHDTRGGYRVNRNELLWAILEKGKRNAKFKFIICISAMANRLYTEEILNEMKNAFGEDILNSIMIVITFPRKGNDYLDKITEELNKQVPKLKKAKFDSKDPIKDQELELKKLLDEVDPYNWTAMEDAKIRINNKAKQLYNDSSNWYNNTHKYIVESNVPTECKNAKENTTKCIENKKETITCKKPQYTCKNEQTSWNTYKYSPLYIFPETKYIAQEIEKTNEIHSSSSSTKYIKYECIEWKRLHFFSFTYYCVSHKNETKDATKTDVPYDCSYKHEVIVDENEMYCKECEMEYWKKKAWKELNIFNSDKNNI